jgi:type II secretory pathway predicted ATPase ExeA
MNEAMDKSVLNFFGFHTIPFSKTNGPKHTFSTEEFREASARLLFALGCEDFFLLTGPVGVGKSVVLHSFLSQLDINRHIPIYIRGAGMSEGELFKAILAAMDREPPRFSQTAKRLFFSLIPELTRKPVIVIDDSQELKDSALLNLKTMTNFGCDTLAKIIIILSGQPELRAKLRLIQFAPLLQRIRLFAHMKSMSLEETCQYIDFQTTEAGAPTKLFSDGAKSDIHRKAEGLPRAVNTVCFRSIIMAALKERKIIDSSDLLLDGPADG